MTPANTRATSRVNKPTVSNRPPTLDHALAHSNVSIAGAGLRRIPQQFCGAVFRNISPIRMRKMLGLRPIFANTI
jgi:hypothetical protein